MADGIGRAELEIFVSLDAFQKQLSDAKKLAENFAPDFKGIERAAADAGKKAGAALSKTLPSNLKFGSIGEALKFGGALNGSIKDLQEYRKALVALRDATPATAGGFQKLNDQIAGVEQTIRNFGKSSEGLEADLAKVTAATERGLKATQAALDRAAAKEAAVLEKRRKRWTNAMSGATIGGAFPLLFGQGAGASVGGALGGGAGGALGGMWGFGLSLVGTAVGTAFDEARKKGMMLADALKDPVKQFGSLQEAALLSSRSVEKNIEALIAAGREEEAAARIKQDLARLGTGDAAGAKAADELKRAWSELSVVVAGLASGPIVNFTRDLTNLLKLFRGGIGPDALARPKLTAPIDAPLWKKALGLVNPATFLLPSFEETEKEKAQRNAPRTTTGEEKAAIERRGKISELEYRLSTQTAQNYEKAALATERQLIDEREKAELAKLSNSNSPQGNTIRENAAKERYNLLLKEQALKKRIASEDLGNKQSVATAKAEYDWLTRTAGLKGQARQAAEAEVGFQRSLLALRQAQQRQNLNTDPTQQSKLAAEVAQAEYRVLSAQVQQKQVLKEINIERQKQAVELKRSEADAQRSLRNARQLSGKEGPARDILTARQEQDQALNARGRAWDDLQNAIKWEAPAEEIAKLQSAFKVASYAVAEAGVKAGDSIREASKSAGKAVEAAAKAVNDAVSALGSARQSAYALLPQNVRREEGQRMEDLIRYAIRKGIIDGNAVVRQYGGGFSAGGFGQYEIDGMDIGKASDLFNKVNALIQGQQNLDEQRANLDKAKDTQSQVDAIAANTDAITDLASKDWNVFVSVSGGGTTVRGDAALGGVG